MLTREQYEALAIRLAPKLLRVAARLTYPDGALAEDLVQSTLVRGYEMMLSGTFTVGPAALSWFVRGMTTEYLAHRRKHRRCQSFPSDHHVLVEVPDPQARDADMLLDTMSDSLALALEQLPCDQRLCVELVDLAECSYQEAAGMLDVPVGTVRSRLSRARLAMARALTQSEGNQ